MDTVRFEYRVPEHVGLAPLSEQAAWERLGEQLALHLSHRLADDQYHLMRAHKEEANDFNTKEFVWSITLEIGGVRHQEMLAELRDKIEGWDSYTLRRERREPKRSTKVLRPTAEQLQSFEDSLPRGGRRILIAPK